ncbi:NF-kappa-B essential modulator [Teleopsis dalmanni]|uniref:NF-kappa-B essential modulator n=1 Tax=Teleopsis dalmanni TaxID=139649 RepID=UPI0018CE25BD|nr:NF-kappa-B essential modulator [Teleopsis dalmanni]
MSDDESFVILGTSPMPSINSSQPESVNSFDSLQRSQIKNEIKLAVEDVSPTSTSFDKVADNVVAEKCKSADASIENIKTETEVVVESKGKERSKSLEERMNKSDAQSIPQPGTSANSSMAASFLLGELNADVLKTSVYSQFPSLCSMEACAEDVVKLQNMMSEYVELKHTLSKVSLTMKQYYERTTIWKEQMQRTETEYKQLLEECHNQIAILRNENLELKEELKSKMVDLKLCDDIRQKDHEKLILTLSEKSSIIENMRTQIEKLEQQQLASFEFVPKTLNDCQNKHEYVDRLEHERVKKQFERQLSELLAENLDLNDVQKQYMDEINCLKVNLTAAKEIIKKSQADIEILRSNDFEKSQIFESYETERKKLKEEMLLLRQQVEIYSKDFVAETTIRQNLATEKDQLLNDLRILQRKNQELIIAAQKQVEEYERLSASSSRVSPRAQVSSATKYRAQLTSKSMVDTNRPVRVLEPPTIATSKNNYSCPICFKGFETLTILHAHVNHCLDQKK